MAGNGTNVEPPKASEGIVNFDAPPNMSSEWLVNGNNLSNTSSGIITVGSSMVEVSSCPPAPMLDSFCPPIWDQPINGQSLGHCNMNVQNDPSASSGLGHVRAGTGWMPSTMLRDSMFLPSVSRMLPHSLLPFPTDSAFLERAARFSCLGGGSFSEMVNPCTIPDPLNLHTRGVGPMQGPHQVFAGDGSIQSPGIESRRRETNMAEVSKEASLLGKNETEGSSSKNEKKSESFMRSRDGAKVVSNIQSDDAEFSGRDAQEELVGAAGESSGKGLGLNKRKRIKQKTENYENNEAPQQDADSAKEKGDQNPSSTSNHTGKHGKQESQGSDPPKEYLHVRARRGQATNSHSLAERIRREKISERMKYLQDLVPGCSKVTGKAVMLDEIINYVQSLQRQVEFLSMKLATVHPQLDFNIEGFLAKDILQPGAGPSSLLALPPDISMPFPPLHPPLTGLNQAGLPGTRSSSEAPQRPISLESTAVCASEVTSQHMQASGVWADELHNVVHNGFNSTAALNTPDLSDNMKSDP